MKQITLCCVLFLLLFSGCSANQENRFNNPANEEKKPKQESLKPVPVPDPEPSIYSAKITAVGDLMVHDTQLVDAYQPKTDSYNFEHAFQQVKKGLSHSDFTIGNLETVLGGKEALYTGYPRFSSPDSFAQSLKNVGFDLLSTANNHSNDRNEAGVLRTIQILDELQIAHVGTYSSQEAQNLVYIKEINTMKFAFVSFTYGTNGIPIPNGKDYLINVLTEELIKTEIGKAKSLNPDFIIALPHMGNEYELIPHETYKKWANLMIESGADIILASHPHVVQPIEIKLVADKEGKKRKVLIAYSLGNFISGQRTEPRDAGIILNLYFKKTGDKKPELTTASYSPTWVQFYNKSNQHLVRTIPVYSVIKNFEAGGNMYDLQKKDIDRVKRVHQELAKRLLNKDIPFTQLQEEYYLQ